MGGGQWVREISEKHQDIRKYMFSGGTRCWVCEYEVCLKLSGSNIQGTALITREMYNLPTIPLRMIKGPTSYLLWELSQPISPSSFRSNLEDKELSIQACFEHLSYTDLFILDSNVQPHPESFGLYFIRNLVLFPFQKQWVVTLAHHLPLPLNHNTASTHHKVVEKSEHPNWTVLSLNLDVIFIWVA